jgi:hypothetical protein
MKTYRFFIVLSVFGFLALNATIAQPKNKDFGGSTSHVADIAFCGTEGVTGTVTVEYKMTSPSWYQVKRHWSMIGDESGAHYEADGMVNQHFEPKPNGKKVDNYTMHFFVKRDNVPVGIMHDNFHIIIGDDGEVIIENDNYFMECFEKP